MQLAKAATKISQVKQPGKLTKGVLFYEENAHVHCGFELIGRPSYSTDLAQSDSSVSQHEKISG